MKKISAVMITGIFFVLTSINAFSQDAIGSKTAVIEPYHLAITYFKTSNLVFPYAIKSVDRGSKDVLVQKAKGVENVLQVKAGKQGFEETNLTVITADGYFYSVILNYSADPSTLNIRFIPPGQKNADALFSTGFMNDAEMQADAEMIMGRKRTVRGIKDKKYGMKFRLNGLFIRDNVMYFKIQLENRSNINYDIDQLRFFIRDQQKSKRTAIQELEVKPLYAHNDTTTVTGQMEHVFIFALPKFTIPDKKHLAIQVMEKNGGRHLELKVNKSAIVRAKALNDKE